VIQPAFDEKKDKNKDYESQQYENTSLIIFLMKAYILSITKDHDNDECDYKNTCKDQLSGRKHFVYFYAKLTF